LLSEVSRAITTRIERTPFMNRDCFLGNALRIGAALAPAVALSVASGGCGRVQEKATVTMPVVADPRLQAVLSYIAGEMSDCSIPGGAIAIVENGHVTESVGFGVEDTATNGPVSATTRFETASLSKVVLGAAALRLVEEGRLDLGKPVTSYVPLTLAPGFDPSSITMTDLLTQTSGLPDARTDDITCGVGAGQLAAWFASQPAQPLWTPPGQVWDFSQRGYAAAGWVIEQASSQSLEDSVTQRVLGPGGMSTATYDPGVALAGDHAVGHDIDPSSGAIRQTYAPGQDDCEAFRATDGVYASVLDYAHLAETLFAGGGTMLTADSVRALETGQVFDHTYPGDQYAYGMYAHEGYKGLQLVRVSGDIHGFDTAFWTVPDQGFAVVIFFDGYNETSGCDAGHPAEVALNEFLDLTSVPGPNWTTSPSTWAAYAGTYVDPYALGTITVTFDGSHLTASTAQTGDIALTQVSATEFTGTLDGLTENVIFAPGPSGAATWFVTRLGVGRRQ
jgi:CubicO group peptidase (beta-lactamase class C family)